MTAGARRGEPMVRRRGEMLDEEPAGILAGAKGQRCQCYEGSIGCLGPPCVTEAPPVWGDIGTSLELPESPGPVPRATPESKP